MRSFGSVLPCILSAVLVVVSGCGESQDPSVIAPEWKPFVELARGSECANTRNRLFLIDQALVFWDRAGDCPDNSYSETLFGKSPDEVLCKLHDSIAGPMKNCADPSYADLFEIMIAHLDEPDLGLGPGHDVRQLPL
jgi:hypothetical protein